MSAEIDLVIVGSIGIDTIQTPKETREEILGGSSSYACSAASFFTKTGMVGVVGTDFPEAFKNKWKEMGIDLAKNWRAYSREARLHIYVSNMKEMVRF